MADIRTKNSLILWVGVPALLIAVFFAWKTWGPYTIINENPTGTYIIALGDSITQGYGAEPDENYPSILAEKIGQPIINAGVDGDTTADALMRLKIDVLNRDPSIVLLCLGGNDLLQRLDPEQQFANLENIIRQCQTQGALVIVIGVSGGPLRPGMNARYRALARRMGCPFIPNILKGIMGDRKLMSDQIHPNAAGYARMAEKIEPILRKFTR